MIVPPARAVRGAPLSHPVMCGWVPIQDRTVIKSERGGSRSDGGWADTVLGGLTQSCYFEYIKGPILGTSNL
jgi:hypothetical protein